VKCFREKRLKISQQAFKEFL